MQKTAQQYQVMKQQNQNVVMVDSDEEEMAEYGSDDEDEWNNDFNN